MKKSFLNKLFVLIPVLLLILTLNGYSAHYEVIPQSNCPDDPTFGGTCNLSDVVVDDAPQCKTIEGVNVCIGSNELPYWRADYTYECGETNDFIKDFLDKANTTYCRGVEQCVMWEDITDKGGKVTCRDYFDVNQDGCDPNDMFGSPDRCFKSDCGDLFSRCDLQQVIDYDFDLTDQLNYRPVSYCDPVSGMCGTQNIPTQNTIDLAGYTFNCPDTVHKVCRQYVTKIKCPVKCSDGNWYECADNEDTVTCPDGEVKQCNDSVCMNANYCKEYAVEDVQTEKLKTYRAVRVVQEHIVPIGSHDDQIFASDPNCLLKDDDSSKFDYNRTYHCYGEDVRIYDDDGEAIANEDGCFANLSYERKEALNGTNDDNYYKSKSNCVYQGSYTKRGNATANIIFGWDADGGSKNCFIATGYSNNCVDYGEKSSWSDCKNHLNSDTRLINYITDYVLDSSVKSYRSVIGINSVSYGSEGDYAGCFGADNDDTDVKVTVSYKYEDLYNVYHCFDMNLPTNTTSNTTTQSAPTTLYEFITQDGICMFGYTYKGENHCETMGVVDPAQPSALEECRTSIITEEKKKNILMQALLDDGLTQLQDLEIQPTSSESMIIGSVCSNVSGQPIGVKFNANITATLSQTGIVSGSNGECLVPENCVPEVGVGSGECITFDTDMNNQKGVCSVYRLIYRCQVTEKKQVCVEEEEGQNCTSGIIPVSKGFKVEDKDFTASAINALALTQVMNEAKHIFNGQSMVCEDGYWDKFDQMSLMDYVKSKAMQVALSYVGGQISSALMSSAGYSAQTCAVKMINAAANFYAAQAGVNGKVMDKSSWTKRSDGSMYASEINQNGSYYINIDANGSIYGEVVNSSTGQITQVQTEGSTRNCFTSAMINAGISPQTASMLTDPVTQMIIGVTVDYLTSIQNCSTCDDEECAFTFNQYKSYQLYQSGNCHYVGSKCTKKIDLGVTEICLRHGFRYCCYDSPFARIIMEQAYKQLGKSWGSYGSPNCQGLTFDEFKQLDFSQMDLSELKVWLESKIKHQLSDSDVEALVNNAINRIDY